MSFDIFKDLMVLDDFNLSHLLLMVVWGLLLFLAVYLYNEKEINKKPAFLKKLLVIYLSIIFLMTTYFAWQGYLENDNWRIGDWLINYQGGFVRRGLFGEVVRWLSTEFHMRPGMIVLFFQVLSYLIYFLFSCLLLMRKGDIAPYVLLIVSPFIFTFQLHDVQGGFRKEILYFAIISFVAWTSVSQRPKVFILALSGSLILFPLLILSHEMFAIYLPYLLAIFALRHLDASRYIVSGSIILTLSGIALLVTMAAKGSIEQVAEICQSWGTYAPLDCGKDGAIYWLSRSAGYGLEMVKDRLKNYDYVGKYLPALILSLVAFIPVRRNIFNVFSNRVASAFIIISLVGSAGLFYVAVDWGRFIYIHLVSFFFITLVVKENVKNPRYTGSPAKLFIEKQFGHRFTVTSSIIVTSLILLLYSVAWRVPHSGMSVFFKSDLF